MSVTLESDRVKRARRGGPCPLGRTYPRGPRLPIVWQSARLRSVMLRQNLVLHVLGRRLTERFLNVGWLTPIRRGRAIYFDRHQLHAALRRLAKSGSELDGHTRSGSHLKRQKVHPRPLPRRGPGGGRPGGGVLRGKWILFGVKMSRKMQARFANPQPENPHSLPDSISQKSFSCSLDPGLFNALALIFCASI